METNERDGVYTKETETHYIDVIPMLFNWRVATTEVEEGNDAEGRGDLHGTRGMRTGETR